MPSPPTRVNPLLPSRAARFKGWWRSFPGWLRWGAVVAFAAGVMIGGWFGAWKWMRGKQQFAVYNEWVRFEKAAKEGDDEEMLAALDEVTALDPSDERAGRYRRALQTGETDADDATLRMFVVFRHLRAKNAEAAAREARKQLAREPNDWLARCAAVSHLLEAGKLDDARTELAALPDPAAHPPSPFALLFAHELLVRTGRNPAKLVRFVNDVVVDVLGASDAGKHALVVKLQLIECYLIAFHPSAGELGNRLSLAAVPVGRLIDQAHDQAVADGQHLAKLGTVCDRLAPAFAALRRSGQITAEQYDGLAKELDDRTQRVWRAVLDRHPKEPAAYLGVSRVQVRRKDPAARDTIAAGLRECGNHPQLLAVHSLLMLQADDQEEALASAFRAAEQQPKNPFLWTLAAETAMAVGRRDAAVFACRKARAISPKHPRALLIEAEVLLGSGDPSGAVQLLAELGEDALFESPELARGYARTRVAAGLTVTAPDLLGRAFDRSTRANSPAAVAAVIAGFADAPYDPAVSAAVLEAIDRVAARWPATDLTVTRAVELARAAEYQEPVWAPARVQAAVAALERARASRPNDMQVAAALAWVRVKAEKAADRGLTDIAPVLAAFDANTPLGGPPLVTLGAVHLANGQKDKAVAALEAARKTGPPSARGSVHLALAYHAAGKTAEARAFLADARTRPMSPQDRLDLAAAEATLLREKQ